MTRLVVTSPADAGQCVGRLDGRVVFARGALPGETVDVEITKRTSKFWRANVLAVLEASPERVEPPCPWFGTCGGCAWLHTDPAHQLVLKAYVVRQTLRRLGGIDWAVDVQSLGLAAGWRTRVTLQIDELGRAGFHAPGSNDVVDVSTCLQAAPELLLDQILAQPWPGVSRVHVSVSEAGRAVIAGDYRDGPAEHHDRVLGRTFVRAADGFWQSHRDAATVLAAAVRELADPVTHVVDLYAGVGLFGLTLLDAMPGARVTMVEQDRVAAGFARSNARGAARVLAVDVKHWRPEPADLVVLDPPRAGAGRAVVEAIVGAQPDTVIYVSCDAATLARDLRWFAQGGYSPDHVRAYDLFPGTGHVEIVTRLRRV